MIAMHRMLTWMYERNINTKLRLITGVALTCRWFAKCITVIIFKIFLNFVLMKCWTEEALQKLKNKWKLAVVVINLRNMDLNTIVKRYSPVYVM